MSIEAKPQPPQQQAPEVDPTANLKENTAKLSESDGVQVYRIPEQPKSSTPEDTPRPKRRTGRLIGAGVIGAGFTAGAILGIQNFLGINRGPSSPSDEPNRPLPTAGGPVVPGNGETIPQQQTIEQINREKLGLNGFHYVQEGIVPAALWDSFRSGSQDFSGDSGIAAAAAQALSELEKNKTWLIETGNVPEGKLGSTYNDVVRATFTNGMGNGSDFPRDLVANNQPILDATLQRAESTKQQKLDPSYPLRDVAIGDVSKVEASKIVVDGKEVRVVTVIANVYVIAPDPESPVDKDGVRGWKVTEQLRSYSLTDPDTKVTGFPNGNYRSMTTITTEIDNWGDSHGSPTQVEKVRSAQMPYPKQ